MPSEKHKEGEQKIFTQLLQVKKDSRVFLSELVAVVTWVLKISILCSNYEGKPFAKPNFCITTSTDKIKQWHTNEEDEDDDKNIVPTRKQTDLKSIWTIIVLHTTGGQNKQFGYEWALNSSALPTKECV